MSRTNKTSNWLEHIPNLSHHTVLYNHFTLASLMLSYDANLLFLTFILVPDLLSDELATIPPTISNGHLQVKITASWCLARL